MSWQAGWEWVGDTCCFPSIRSPPPIAATPHPPRHVLSASVSAATARRRRRRRELKKKADALKNEDVALTIMREKVTPNMVLVDDALTDEVRHGGSLSGRRGL